MLRRLINLSGLSVWAFCLLSSAEGQGTLSLQFYEPVMNGIGLPVSELRTSALPESPGYDGFAVSLPALTVLGGFALDGKALSLTLEPGPREIQIAPAFVLKRCHRGHGRWMQGDLCLAPAFAKAHGIPEHAGRVVGVADVVLPSAFDPIGVNDPLNAESAEGHFGKRGDQGGDKGGDCIAPFGPDIDVQLSDIDDIGAVHWDADRVAFAPSAVLHNVGTNAIRWYWAIFPSGWNGPNIGEHPFLALNLYRLDADGSFLHIGRSDLKHAWNTVNFSCPCPGGQVMWPGCMDVYGVANNNNQYFFAPRDELTAHTAAWNSMGSHFDATPVDNQRDHFDLLGEHDPFEHRLSASTADLLVTNARYFAEAWYIAAGDTNLFNSIGYREIVPSYTINAGPGGVPGTDLWSFSFAGPFKPGPAIYERPGVERLDTGEGNVLLAAESNPLPDGTSHYRYTLMNLDYDRQLAQFEVPVVAGSVTAQHVFEDGDGNPSNDWSAVVAAGSVRWSGPSIDWGRLVSFEFVSDAAGLAGSASILALEPSTTGAPAASMLAAAASPNVAPSVIPVIALAEFGGIIRCSWNAVPGGSYQLQFRDDTLGWIDRGVTVTATSAQGEYLELNPEQRGLYRVQLLSLP